MRTSSCQTGIAPVYHLYNYTIQHIAPRKYDAYNYSAKYVDRSYVALHAAIFIFQFCPGSVSMNITVSQQWGVEDGSWSVGIQWKVGY